MRILKEQVNIRMTVLRSDCQKTKRPILVSNAIAVDSVDSSVRSYSEDESDVSVHRSFTSRLTPFDVDFYLPVYD